MEKMLKTITAVSQAYGEQGPFIFEGTIDDVIASLVSIRDSIPEEYRGTARFTFETHEDAGVVVEYQRPMTPDEQAEYQGRHTANLERQRQENKELAAAIRAYMASPEYTQD